MTQREERIVELAQEQLAEIIKEYVTGFHEEWEADGEIDEDTVKEIVEDIFEAHKHEIEEAAIEEWNAGSERSKIFDAIYKGFSHYVFCVDTAKEKAREC